MRPKNFKKLVLDAQRTLPLAMKLPAVASKIAKMDPEKLIKDLIEAYLATAYEMGGRDALQSIVKKGKK